ncbi:hypothetical protein [Alkaliphilus peptidifermentans]|uniref:hypothetical protein n=1 Tax=Alkaliphilus peptidifermentans TaxID=426129 RepID=UPI000B867D16|nr:hypothetical protein [Alkaliphilus peptidifermentans]
MTKSSKCRLIKKPQIQGARKPSDCSVYVIRKGARFSKQRRRWGFFISLTLPKKTIGRVLIGMIIALF